MEQIRVLIADDMMILRQGLKAVLEQDAQLEVVALAEDGRVALEKCKIHEPDVVLMDMRMPEYDGEYGIRGIKEAFPDIKVLVLTTFDDDETIEKAVRSGADGYILKESEDAKVIAAVKSVHQGISVFGDSVYDRMRRQFQSGQWQNRQEDNQEETDFTGRERDVLRLVAQGYDNKEISALLFLAEGTVRNLVSRLLEKTGRKDRTQLAVYAVKRGLDE